MPTADTRRRPFFRPSVLLAGLLGLVTAAGSAAYLWQSSRYADFFLLARRIEFAEKVSPEALHVYAQRATAIVDAGICRSDVVSAGLTVILADLDTRSEDADFDGWSAAMQAADRYIVHALTCMPTNGNAWLRLAMVRRAVAENPDEIARLMQQSAWYAPAEDTVLLGRFAVWQRASAATLSAAASVVDQDILTLLGHVRPRDVAGALDRASPALAARVRDIAVMIDEPRLERLRAAGLTWLPVRASPQLAPSS